MVTGCHSTTVRMIVDDFNVSPDSSAARQHMVSPFERLAIYGRKQRSPGSPPGAEGRPGGSWEQIERPGRLLAGLARLPEMQGLSLLPAVRGGSVRGTRPCADGAAACQSR